MTLAERVTPRRLRFSRDEALKTLLVLGLLSSLSGCLLIPEDRLHQALNAKEQSGHQIYKLYPGSTRLLSDLAIVVMGDVSSASIDGLNVSATDYQEIHLLPGQHMLAWRKGFGFSVMVEPTMMKVAEMAIAVQLQAGHVYRLFADRTYGTGYRFYYWIEDAADGKVIGGTKKP